MSVDLVVGAESRYDRQERISWWEQSALEQARVLVVGAGALGNEVVKNLALMGVGSIVVVDFDTVEMSNLARCVLLRSTDDGTSKALAVATRARELNDSIEVTGLHQDVRALGSGLARRAHVIVGALDNREARLYLNRVAWQAGRPWVDGAIEALYGVARVFTPPDSCYECTLTHVDFEALAHRQSCRLLSYDDLIEGKVPTVVPTASIIGGLQAQEVVKLLHRSREGVSSLPGAIIFDGANNDAYPLTYPFDGDCPAHHTYVEPVQVDRTADLTFGELAEIAGLPHGTVELADDLIVSWACPSCATSIQDPTPLRTATIEVARCPGCGAARQPTATTTVEPASPLRAMTLDEVGFCDDDLLAVRDDDTYRYVWPRRPNPGLPESWR